MASQSLKFVLLSSLGLSLFAGNTAALAQLNSPNSDVVVPTNSGGTSTPIDTSTNGSSSTSVSGAARFSCQSYNGQYTVMYQPESQPNQYFPWAAPAALGGGWNPQMRCATIATRLESYRQDGLTELQTSQANNENIICVTSEANPSCRIVLTVPRGKDPYTVRNSVFQNLVSADSGQQTTAINTYTNSSGGGINELYNLGRTLLGGNNRVNSSKTGINLKPFLDPKDGGTARNFRNGVAIRRQTNPTSNTGNRLNPRTFR